MGVNVLGCQSTIAREFSLSGIGVHTGKNVTVSFFPADADTGIIFSRVYADGTSVDFNAVSSQVGVTSFCTVLGNNNGAHVATVEHLMAALSGLSIDNIIIEIDGDEVPIMDGSSAAFIDAITEVGIESQTNHPKRYIRVIKPVRFQMEQSWAEFVPHEGTRFEIEIDFETPAIGRQSWAGEISPETFASELSRARTFGFMRDVENLWAAGYALGSSLDNSIVIGEDHKIINIEGLRFQDEFVRHKTLDAVGDLALAGAQFIGCYRSYRGGHKLNAYALEALLKDKDAYEIVEAPGSRVKARCGELVAVNSAVFAPWAR